MPKEKEKEEEIDDNFPGLVKFLIDYASNGVLSIGTQDWATGINIRLL